jgi:hypothetical protein
VSGGTLCPLGASKIGTADACNRAAATVGETYRGWSSYIDRPSGCIMYGTSSVASAASGISFNAHPTGTSFQNPNWRPLCAGAR